MNSTGVHGLLPQYKDLPFGWTFDDPPTFDPFNFEIIADLTIWTDFIKNNRNIAFYAGAIYIVTIFGLQRYMKNRPAYKLKYPLFLWNLALGIFSIFGFIRVLPDLAHALNRENGFYTSICVKKFINIPTAYWLLMFLLSKYVELGDTVFIVLRKRPLIFLQWYHHLITMTASWITSPLLEPINRWYAVLNFGVHSLMYPYFALRAIDVKIPRRLANVITTLQLTQMIIGVFVNMSTLYIMQSGNDCARYPISIKTFNVVYGSFALLFGKLFYDSVLKPRKTKVKIQ